MTEKLQSVEFIGNNEKAGFSTLNEFADWNGDFFGIRRKQLKDAMESWFWTSVQNRIVSGKHGWCLQYMSNWDSTRPWEFPQLSAKLERILRRWIMSEHNLEVETFRYYR